MEGNTGRLLYESHYNGLVGDFSTWRVDDFMRQMEATKSRGRILPFVRGLRLSAHLIYTIREILSVTDFTASWGHLLDEEQNFCSAECDIIIHHKGHHTRWNGTSEPIMDFKFIEQERAVAVISCKSFLKSSHIDREYCKLMKPFVRRIWLFAECCGPKSVENIRNKANKSGYEKFWHLYTWSKKDGLKRNPVEWNNFVKAVRNIK